MGSFSEVERLFARHKLGPVHLVEPITGGQLNTAYRVNEEWVLRCRDAARATGSLKREAAVLKRVQGRVPVAEPLTSGMDDILGEYIIQKHVPGQSMLRAWLENPDVGTR